jgi:hypothetical protein
MRGAAAASTRLQAGGGMSPETLPTLSIGDVSVTEGNTGTVQAIFTVSLSETSPQTVAVVYETADGTATLANDDYQYATGALIIPANSPSATVTVLVTGDTKREGDETFLVNLRNPGNATIADGQGVGTIVNDDTPPALTIADLTPISEGNSGTTAFTFTVSLSNTTDQTVTVQYQTADGTATTSNTDYVPASGTLTILPKVPSGFITVLVNGDLKFEGDETFSVNLSNPVNATIGDGQGVGTIRNDDQPPNLTIGDVSVTEGNSGLTDAVFTLTLSHATDQPVTVDFHTVDNTATLANQDFVDIDSYITIPPKALTATLTVRVVGDIKYENNESFYVNLSNGVNATITDGQAVGTIVNDDNPPTISINDVTVSEGLSGTTAAVFTVSLSTPTDRAVSVSWQTLDSTATAASGDYVAASGTINLSPKTPSATLTVLVNGDAQNEADERFQVRLSSPTNATIADNLGIATILNDDAVPSISIGDVQVTEGNSGTIAAVFAVTLSNPTDQTVTVHYQTADNTATIANADYVTAAGNLSFPPLALSATVTVTVNGDTKREGNETFLVNLSAPTHATLADGQGVGTITNDDAVPGATIDDVKVIEGSSGMAAAMFTVTLSNTTDQAVTIAYQTADGTATTGDNDYEETSGVLTIPAKTLSATITVPVNGDTQFEPFETFAVDLSSPVNATLLDAHGVGTISNDDGTPTLSLGDVTVTEGNAGATAAVLTVSLSNATALPVKVGFRTTDGTATLANGDYGTVDDSLTIAPGQTSAAITVLVNGDLTFETDETLAVDLANPTNATIDDGHAVITVTNDDTVPAITIGNVSVAEGNGGTTAAVVALTLDHASAQTVTVSYQTADGTATLANADYVESHGSVQFAPKTTTAWITVLVTGDTKLEPDEGLMVDLSGAVGATIADAQGAIAIANDDTVPPMLWISDATVTEGNSGTTIAVLTVTLSQPSGYPVSVHWSTSDGSATIANQDYVTSSGDLTFAPKDTSKTLGVFVRGDTRTEADENFLVNLSAASGATIIDGHAFVTIANDDSTLSRITIADASANEDAGAISFALSLDQAAGLPIRVHYQTVDGTATAANDYVMASGDVTFAAKETQKTVTVQLVTDCTVEPNEAFTVTLSANTGPSTIQDGSGLGTVNNDDLAPAAPNGLTATQVLGGNDGDGTTRIRITYGSIGTGNGIEVWRAGYGHYPEYDDAGGAVPALPAGYPPSAPWALTSVSGSGQSDEVTQRDVWYYVAYVRDACGNVSAVSSMSAGTLNYYLGDWHTGAAGGECQGNNQVNTADLSFLGAHYGITLAHASDPYACLDVGPTTTGTVGGRPSTDDKVQFEDFVLFALNYQGVSSPTGIALERATSPSDQVKLSVPAMPAVGQTFNVGIDMNGSGYVQALSLLLNFDPAIVEPKTVLAGELLGRQAGPSKVLSSAPGNVDVAILGTDTGGIYGNGRLAQVTFQVKAAGLSRIAIRSLEARNELNESIPIGFTAAGPATVDRTALGAPMPNPFVASTAVRMSLARSGLARVGVFDVSGRRVRTLVNGYQVAGERLVSWDGRDEAGGNVAAGLYVIRMEAGGAHLSRRVAVVR